MSNKEDEYFSGTSLDVAEQNSSNPPASALAHRQATGSQQSNGKKDGNIIASLNISKGKESGQTVPFICPITTTKMITLTLILL